MKTILLLVIGITTANARLGEDITQLRARYGVETIITVDGSGNGAAIFQKSGLEITCELAAGKTRLIAFRPLNSASPLSADDAARIVAANRASATEPLTILVTDPANGYTLWQDKANTRTAIYRPANKNTPLLIYLDTPEPEKNAPPPRKLDDF